MSLGSGSGCDTQFLFSDDVLRDYEERPPLHAKSSANISERGCVQHTSRSTPECRGGPNPRDVLCHAKLLRLTEARSGARLYEPQHVRTPKAASHHEVEFHRLRMSEIFLRCGS